MKQGDNGVVANATYLIGQEARDFLVDNLSYIPEEINDDLKIQFNGNLYSSEGINYRGNYNYIEKNPDTSKGVGFWSLAVLREIELLSTLELSPSTESEVSSLAAKITGDGSIRYTGEGTIRLTSLNEAYNDYTGTTTIDGQVTVIADEKNALGQSERVIIGSDESSGTLKVNADQENLDGLVVNDIGTLSIAQDKVMTIIGSSDSVINGALSGLGTLNLQTTYATSNVNTLNGFEGSLAVAKGTLAIDVAADKTDTLKKKLSIDADSQLEKLGAGKLDFDYTVNDLNVNLVEGGLVLGDGDSLAKFAVAENTEVDVNGLVTIAELTGSGATFNMEVALGDGSQEELKSGSAGLHIETGEGAHFLNVSPKDLNKGAEESIKVVQIDNGTATFSLAGGAQAVTSGAFDYLLVTKTQNDVTSYFLDSTSDTDEETPPDVGDGVLPDEGDEPVSDTGNEPGSDIGGESGSGTEHIRNTTVTAGSYIGIAYAAQLFDLSLHDRVGNRDWINPVTGEKHSTSLWMHHTVSRESFGDSTGQLKMRSTSNTTMLGGDIVQFTTDNSGLAYAGIMGGYGSMDTKSRSKVTHLRSKAETDAWGVGVYGGWKADSEGQTGPYVDGWLMFTHADSDITGVDRSVESVKGRGLSASLEAGWGFKVASVQTDNGKIANFTVEPHASVTWFGMEYDEIHNEAQDVTFEGKNNVRTRLGTRLIVTEEGNKDFDAFVEANWVHNTQEYGATISGLTVDQAGSRNLGEARIGVDWHVTDSLSVWARAGVSYGSDDYREREGSVGARYQF